MRSAVSARPLRAPWVEVKYSITSRPSMKEAFTGRSMISPFGLAIRPRMPASWRICLIEPRAPDEAIMKIEFSSSVDSMFSIIASPTASVAAFHLSVTAWWRSSSRDEAVVVLLLDRVHLGLEAGDERVLGRAGRRRRSSTP